MALTPSGQLTGLSTSGVAALTASIPNNAQSITAAATATGAPTIQTTPNYGFQPASLRVASNPVPNDIVNQPPLTNQSPLQYPADIGKYFFKINVANYSRASWNSIGTFNTEQTIVLPLPELLTDAHTVDYQQIPLGMTGAGALMLGTQGAAALEAAKKNADMTIAARAGLDALSTVDLVGGGNPSAGFQAAFGIGMNEYMIEMLKGPAYCVREFRWKFSPRSAKESQTLNRILTALKNAQAVNTVGGVSAFFSWPKIFALSFMSFDQPNAMSGPQQNGRTPGAWLYGFKPCVLNDLIVNYSPIMPSFHRDHSPESIELQLRFTELEFWLQGEFKDFGGQSDSSASPAPNITLQAFEDFVIGAEKATQIPGLGPATTQFFNALQGAGANTITLPGL